MGKLTSHAAILPCSNFEEAIAYWRDRLGFDPYAIYGEPPSFAILIRDGCRVMIGQRTSDQPIVPYWKVRDGLWNVYFWVSDVDAVFAEMKQRGAIIDYGLENKPYDVREFGICDPDGHNIGFGQVLG